MSHTDVMLNEVLTFVQYEHRGSLYEEEKLHGAAPDQEEKRVRMRGLHLIKMLADFEE